jgi:hypothetical protein
VSRVFLFPTASGRNLGNPGALSPKVKLQEYKARHSTPSSVEVKKMWIYTSTLAYAFIA